MRSWKGMPGRQKLAVGAAVIAVLAGAAFVATQQLGGPDKRTARQPRPTESASRADTKLTGKPLELGEAARISSNYRVAVTDVTVYEGADRNVLAATMEAEYIGSADGEPWADLIVEFRDARARTFGESDCPAGVGGASDEAVLAAGEVGDHVVCIDLATRDVEGGRIIVEEALAKSKRVSWSTNEVETRRLPSPAPAPAGVNQPPAASGQENSSTSTDNRVHGLCREFDEEEYEEYKEWGDGIKRQYEAYKDAGGDDEEKLDEYEDWKARYDKHIDGLAKLKDAC